MKSINVKNGTLEVPAIALGCMRLPRLSEAQAEQHIRGAMELGINFFDHADIYGNGEAEQLFSKAIGMNSTTREQMILQSKCGIRSGYFDFSKEYIIQSTDTILQRLGTDYLDILLLHRPDTLMDPEEVAEAFAALRAAGKVRHFGVSNQNSYQMELLGQALEPDAILFNQLQLSIAHCPIIDEGINFNMADDLGVSRSGGTLEYCRLHDITIQAWSPFQYGFFSGVFLGHDDFPQLNKVIEQVAETHGVSTTTIPIAWLLRHPAKIQPVVGTTNPQRLADIAAACSVQLSREEWYEIYLAAGKRLP